MTASATGHSIHPDILARRWWILTVLCTSLMIVIVGNTALNIALPTLARDLDATTTQLQWMVDAYSLIFAGLLFMAGAIGDRYGRKGALQVGLVIFFLGSLTAALASGAGQVIAGRTIMGIGGAFIMPSTLSILTNVFPPHERAKAIAVWAGISGGGAAFGPIISGFLLEHFWWGSVFLVNLPIIVISLVAGHFLVPTSRDPEQTPLDVVGALLSIGSMVSLVYAIIEAPNHGWVSLENALFFAVAAAFIGAFVRWELRTPNPMLDLRYFQDRRFSVSSSGMTLVFFAMFGSFFLLTQYFQLVLGYGTLEAGLKQAPFAIVMMAIAPQSPRFVNRFGPARVVSTGLALVAVGLALLATITTASSSYLLLLLPLCVLPAGMALTISPMTAQIMSAVPMGKAGVGSAMNDTTRELGGALGVAVLGSLVTSRYTSQVSDLVVSLPAQAQTLVLSGLSGAQRVAAQLPGEAGDALNQATKDAFMSGMHLATAVGAVVVAAAAVLVRRLMPAPRTVADRVALGIVVDETRVDEPRLAPEPRLGPEPA